MSEEPKFNNNPRYEYMLLPKVYPQFLPNFFPPCDILLNLMFLYSVTTLQDAFHCLFILGLTVDERKGEQWNIIESHQDVCLSV